jgi:phosphatidylserine synthase
VAAPGWPRQRGTFDRVSVIEAHSTRAGRWLRERRLRFALWIAILEGIVVALEHDITRWTVLVLAIAVLAIYILWARTIRWDAGRQVAWIVAASQSLALLVVILAFIVKIFAIVLVIGFAIIALAYLFSDLRRT